MVVGSVNPLAVLIQVRQINRTCSHDFADVSKIVLNGARGRFAGISLIPNMLLNSIRSDAKIHPCSSQKYFNT